MTYTSGNPIDVNRKLVDDHLGYETGGTMMIDVLLELYTDDVKWSIPGRGISVEGKAAAEKNYREIFDGLGNIRFETLWRLATGEYVFDRSRITFTVTKEGHFSGIPKDQEGELALVHRFRMRDGKICEEEVYELPPGTFYEMWNSPSTQE